MTGSVKVLRSLLVREFTLDFDKSSIFLTVYRGIPVFFAASEFGTLLS